MDDKEQYDQTMEESYYYQTLADTVGLMLDYGTKKVLSDLLDLAINVETTATQKPN